MPIGEIDGTVKKQVGDQTYYFGTVTSDKIKGLTIVPVVERSRRTYVNEIDEQGYQRPGSYTRMRQFMKYLKENPSSVVPPVLLSGREWEFTASREDERYGKIVINSQAAIVDGQHRVGGYIALYEEYGEIRPIDFIVLTNMDINREKTEFLTVNNTQKGVPKALRDFLSDKEEARLAWSLNTEEDSPFKDKINRTGAIERTQLFKLHSVAKQVKKTLDHGKFVDLDEDDKLGILIQYWTIIADEFPEIWNDIEKLDDVNTRGRNDFEYKMLELTGFTAWSLMGPEILGRSYVDGIGLNGENVRNLVRICGDIDWRKDGQYNGKTGEYGAGVMKRDMERLLPADRGALNNDERE